jgi:hypothetical protein
MRKRQARHQRIASKSRRRRHAARGGRITGNTTVYVAGAGWRDNDTSMQVIGMDKAVVQKQIDALMKEEAKRGYDDESYDSVSDAMDGIAYYGVSTFALKDIVSARELPEAIREINDLGYYYPEMP